jgi:esterase
MEKVNGGGTPVYLRVMDLAFRDLGGSGALVVILHGLFGSSQNWAGFGRRLTAAGHVVAVDLRNHGDSPAARPHTLAACVEDLAAWADGLAPGPSAGGLRLIGHSMGGLVAMSFALRFPGRTAGVAALDIAPRAYPPGHEREFRALRTDLSVCRSRADLDALLSPLIPEQRQRQFLLTNAVRDGEGFRWRLNADVLEASTVAADMAALAGRFEGESLLVACGRSPYVRAEDTPLMRRFFPRAVVERIEEADHWPHVSAPERLQAALIAFLDRCNNRAPAPSSMA